MFGLSVFLFHVAIVGHYGMNVLPWLEAGGSDARECEYARRTRIFWAEFVMAVALAHGHIEILILCTDVVGGSINNNKFCRTDLFQTEEWQTMWGGAAGITST